MYSVYDSFELDVTSDEHGNIRINGENVGVTSYGYYTEITRDDAIAAARAILKHFGEGLE